MRVLATKGVITMKTLIKTATGAAMALMLAAPASAGEGYACERTRLSSEGFNTRASAENFYPEEIWFEIEEDRVLRSYYGPGDVEPDGTRRLLKIPLEGSLGVSIRLFTDGRATVQGTTGPRFVTLRPSRYQCRRVNIG